MMVRWWEHSQKGVTDRRMDGQTENTICRAALSQLKTHVQLYTKYETSMFNILAEFHTYMSHAEKKACLPFYHAKHVAGWNAQKSLKAGISYNRPYLK